MPVGLGSVALAPVTMNPLLAVPSPKVHEAPEDPKSCKPMVVASEITGGNSVNVGVQAAPDWEHERA